MKDKFNMPVEDNIFVAKRIIIDSIWKIANLDGIAVTYNETESIYYGLTIQKIKVDKVIAINNLKRAWNFILSHTEYETDYNFILAINPIVGGAGFIKDSSYISGINLTTGRTDWTPNGPDEALMKEEIEEIMMFANITERSIELLLYLMRKQAFRGGNKRTAILVANHIMVSHGKGIISLPNKYHDEFRKLSVEFYETNDNKKIKRFIFENAIDGIDFSKESRKKVRDLKDIPLTMKIRDNNGGR